jgi:hypothetical protein
MIPGSSGSRRETRAGIVNLRTEDREMKRLLFGGLVALGLAVTAAPAWADCYFESTCCRHSCFVWTGKSRCWTFNSHCNPLPCISSHGGGYSGPAPWNALAAYGPYGYPPRPAVAVAPAAAAPPAPAAPPSFKAPPPAPATKNSTSLQQAGYFYYGQTNNAGYGPSAGYNYGTGYGYDSYGYGAGYSYAQAPNYWY